MAAIAVEHGNAPGAAKLCDILVKGGVEHCWLSVLQARTALLQQDQDAARSHARQASALGTEDPHIANQLGVILSRTGWHAEAVPPMRLAVEHVPKNPDYRYNLAVALQFEGELAEAELQFRELVRLDPGHASGWLALVQLAKEPDKGWQETLERQLAASSDPDQRLLFGHALARLAESAEEWDASLTWLDRAKGAKRGEVDHDRKTTGALVDAAIASSSTQSIAETPEGDERPIFIVGMPRSGTTLVERILSSHSQVTSVGELSDFAILLKRTLGTPGPHVLEPQILEAAAKAPDLDPVGQEYLRRAGMLAKDSPRFIDKMPFNSFYVPAILRALPGARVICLRRSPFDMLFANYRQLFATGFSYYSYNYDFGDTAHFVAQFERMAKAYQAALPEGRFMAIAYEDIIEDQRGKTEELLAFCDLDWEEACMDFHQNRDPVATASSVQVRQPLYSSSIAQWRRYSEGGQRAVEELGRYGIKAGVD
ncbi:Sulfotransferase family protein [Altererythrobacter xiamenensis]|uniref:Sulfotransferase family protein n=2 Tax=Altererythrobacter xiamenensis TaxID=1316679 RepID=A0A1Y6EPW8_9SPHN|nr:Sulfotransferase family protein [Altererythrobacter xiamenensis]